MRYYKVLGLDGSAYHGGNGKWGKPSGERPGKWMRVTGKLVPCRNGLHICRAEDLIRWLGPTIWEVEWRGECVEHADKMVVREARLLRRCKGWNATSARLFACDCAAHVLKLFEKVHPDDKRPREAIRVARRYARGKATDAELAAAADAAGAAWTAAAAWTATWYAADAAAAGWYAAAAGWYAAAAGYAAAAERKWQTKRLAKLLEEA